MNMQEIIDGLTALGFTSGYGVSGEPPEIILWEHDAEQPDATAIAKAAIQGAYEREYADVQRQREFAYRAESDVLRDYWLREENGVTKEDWLAKVAEIRERYPYPVKEDN